MFVGPHESRSGAMCMTTVMLEERMERRSRAWVQPDYRLVGTGNLNAGRSLGDANSAT